MTKQEVDVVAMNSQVTETMVNSNRQTETPWPFYGACINAAVTASCLASLTLIAGVSPRPWIVFMLTFYIPVGSGLAMYLGLRYLKEK